MKKRLIIIAIVLFIGCADEARSPTPAPAFRSPSNGTEVAVKPLINPRDNFTDIEITLEAPADPIDGFIISWGQDPNQLTQSHKITVDQLTRSPSSGEKPAYIYVLKDIKNSEKLFVSIASYVNGAISKGSAPFEVK